MKIDQLKIGEWLAEWGESWTLPELVEKTRFETSGRLRSSLGRCQPQSGIVRIHPALLDEPEAMLREVICHEAAHVAAHLRHGTGVRPHGKEWRELMRAAGYVPRARIHVDGLSQSMRAALAPKVVFEHRCGGCGMNRMAHRRMPAWRCRRCWEAGSGGKLQILERAGSDVLGG
jgi:SprT protein